MTVSGIASLGQGSLKAVVNDNLCVFVLRPPTNDRIFRTLVDVKNAGEAYGLKMKTFELTTGDGDGRFTAPKVLNSYSQQNVQAGSGPLITFQNTQRRQRRRRAAPSEGNLRVKAGEMEVFSREMHG